MYDLFLVLFVFIGISKIAVAFDPPLY